ncbi:MAG: hypothetical protein A2428_16940 [Bdellovibrionales bacterium RIFOXYC1_FULL_54_43]|nr:MAG: hypothetical protein A2428_16940 [Bdellovibrionales bacterium RIFOXYC1_FULL_54_43]OFZ83520.1 MAG: hypothetical protein A2603_15350 [Bdellovibrionales bacterium RIFOXYD1_FULL_55_31]
MGNEQRRAAWVLATFIGICGALVSSWGAGAGGATQFIYVNGGYDEATNYSVHEEDLLAFKGGLFRPKASPNSSPSASDGAIFLNAGGPGSAVVPISRDGSFERDQMGWITTRPSRIPFATGPATQNHVTEVFRKLSKENPRRVTAVYADHGEPAGAALWDGTRLGPKAIHQNYDRLPGDPLIRSIHIHCFGGAAIVDPERVVPSEIQKFDSFVAANYPKNRCAFALASEDERAQYVAWSSDWVGSAWTKFFKKHPQPSLAGLKSEFTTTSPLKPTPVLTSDYLANDIFRFMCKREKMGRRIRTSTVCGELSLPVSIPSGESLKRILCEKDDLSAAIQEESENLERFARTSSQLQAIKRYWINRYIEKKSPEVLANYRKYSEKVDQLRAQALISKGKRSEDRLWKEYFELRERYSARYDRAVATLARGNSREFVDYFEKNCDREWLRKNKEHYPEFVDYYFQKNNARFKLWRLGDWLSKFFEEAQQKRRTLNLVHQKERTKLLHVLFSDPEFAKTKKVYENIQDCENSVLN